MKFFLLTALVLLAGNLFGREYVYGYAKVQRGTETFYSYVQFNFDSQASDSDWMCSEVQIRYQGFDVPRSGVQVQMDSSREAKFDATRKLRTRTEYKVDEATGKKVKTGTSPRRTKHIRILRWKANDELVYANPSEGNTDIIYTMKFDKHDGWHLSGGGTYPIMDGRAMETIKYESVQRFVLPNAVVGN